MDPLKIDRINELYRKSKTSGLTVEELREQEALRKEYAALFRNNLKQQLENLTVIDEDGREYKLKKK